MKLATLRTVAGFRAVGVVEVSGEPRFVDLAAADPTLPDSLRKLIGDPTLVSRAEEVTSVAAQSGNFVDGVLAAPIPDPGKVICIGLNYRDHAAESGMEVPSEPVCFSKFSSAIIGPEDAIQIPSVAKKVDYEAELVVVIGTGGRGIAEGDARSRIAGYTNGHDVSARDWQIGRPGGQWLLGKTPDTFAPIGPFLVTDDEIADPNDLRVQLRLNDQLMQDGSPREFIFQVEKLVAFLSQFMDLKPGDLIFTGTPPGVGMARKPPVWLQPGDVAEIEIEGLGVLRNTVEAT